MITSTTTNTWNISGPDFLLLYGVLCGLAGAAVWIRRRGLLDKQRSTDHAASELDVYQLAMLAGGPSFVITTAATKLHRAGLLARGKGRGTLELGDSPAAPGTGLERAVLDAVRARPGISLTDLRRELRAVPAIEATASELERRGLLVAPAKRTRLRRELTAIGGLLVVLGCLRIAAGLSGGRPVTFLVLGVIAVAVLTPLVVRGLPHASSAGRKALEHVRSYQPGPQAMDAAMAVALGGAGALWLADPVIAADLGVPRSAAGSGSGSAGGCGGGGCGGCGGGCGG